MALSIVDADQQQTSDTTISRTLDSLAAGDLIVVFYEVQNSSATVTTPAGYVDAVSVTLTGTTIGGIWAWPSNVTETNHIVTFSHDQAAAVQNIQVWQVRSDAGSFVSGVADKTNSSTQASGNSVQPGTTGTLSQAVEFAVAAAITPQSNDGSEAITEPFTIRAVATHNRCVLGEEITSTTDALNPTLSWLTTRQNRAMIATFAEPSGDATASPAATATTTTIPRAAINAGTGPAATSATTSIPQPGADVGSGPTAVAGTAAVPQAGVNVNASPTTIAATVAVPRARIDRPVPVSSTSTVVAVPQPAADVGVSSSTVAVAVAVPQATPVGSGGATVTPGTVSLTVTVPQTADNVAAGPAVVAATAAVPQPLVAVAASPAVIARSFTIPQAAPSGEGGTTATPAVVATTVAIAQVGMSVTAGPSVVATTVTLPAASAAGSYPIGRRPRRITLT